MQARPIPSLRWVHWFLALFALSVAAAAPSLQAAECDDRLNALNGGFTSAATLLTQEFDSGSSWELCWLVDEHAGLVLTEVHYAAPGEEARKVLDAASVAQILFKYDEDTEAHHILADPGLGGQQWLEPSTQDCAAGSVLADPSGQQICSQVRDINNLTRVRNSTSLRRRELSLHGWSKIGTHIYQTIWRLSEDGEITPSVAFTGRINRYTTDARFGVPLRLIGEQQLAANASLLFNWRLDFNINNTPNNDIVEEIEFPAQVTDVVRRSISVTALQTEALRNVDRELFRGWRVRDADQSAGAAARSRIGYYLDPQESGFSYRSRQINWAQFDFFVTQKKDCEQYASANDRINPGCNSSLDYYTDGEPLDAADPVLWFSRTTHFSATAEDYPAIAVRETGFRVIPFDWSAHTPFTPPQP